jgi:hypothetical protein
MKITIQQINETKSWFFVNISKIGKPLAKLIKRKEKIQINKIKDEKGNITIDINEIQIIQKYFKNYTPGNWKIKNK